MMRATTDVDTIVFEFPLFHFELILRGWWCVGGGGENKTVFVLTTENSRKRFNSYRRRLTQHACVCVCWCFSKKRTRHGQRTFFFFSISRILAGRWCVPADNSAYELSACYWAARFSPADVNLFFNLVVRRLLSIYERLD